MGIREIFFNSLLNQKNTFNISHSEHFGESLSWSRRTVSLVLLQLLNLQQYYQHVLFLPLLWNLLAITLTRNV